MRHQQWKTETSDLERYLQRRPTVDNESRANGEIGVRLARD
jgi:hypothetical protein